MALAFDVGSSNEVDTCWGVSDFLRNFSRRSDFDRHEFEKGESSDVDF